MADRAAVAPADFRCPLILFEAFHFFEAFPYFFEAFPHFVEAFPYLFEAFSKKMLLIFF